MQKAFPKSVVLCNIAGACNAGLLQFEAAINSYKKALKIMPDYAQVHFNMAGDLHPLPHTKDPSISLTFSLLHNVIISIYLISIYPIIHLATYTVW